MPRNTWLRDRILVAGAETVDFNHEKLKSILLFWLKLLAVGLVFRAVLLLDPPTALLQEIQASYTGYWLQAVGLDPTVKGSFIHLSGETYLITRDCLGWKSMFLFIGLVFASAKKVGNLRFFLPTGLLVILAANNLRILSTIFLVEAGFFSWDVIHGFLWRWGLTAVVLLVWSTWLLKSDIK